MSSAPSASSAVKNPRRPNFVIFFLIFVGVCGFAGFMTLRYAAKSGVAARREQSREHLLALGKLLSERVSRAERSYPHDFAGLIDASHADLTVNPAWPDEAGYIYVTGVRSDDPPDSLLLFENVPPEKRKLGRLVLRLDGKVELLTEDQFQQRLDAQRMSREAVQRPWRTEAVAVRPER